MTKNTVSGFDMAPTIEWYAAHAFQLYLRLPVSRKSLAMEFDFHQEVKEPLLQMRHLYGLLNLFPPQARARSNFEELSLLPRLWFHHDSTPQAVCQTNNMSDAISPTAIIPSKVDYEASDQPPGFTSHIKLFDIDESVASLTVRKIIWSQGFVHEFAHSLVTPELYRELPPLRLQSGQVVKGQEYLLGFQALADSYPPISHYVTSYMRDGKLIDAITPLNEAIVETITAYLFGFAASPDGTGLDPFATRASLRDFVAAFLNAERIS